MPSSSRRPGTSTVDWPRSSEIVSRWWSTVGGSSIAMPSPAIGGLGCDRLDMKFLDTDVVGARRIVLERRTDGRGFFARAWCRSEFAEAGGGGAWGEAPPGSDHQA